MAWKDNICRRLDKNQIYRITHCSTESRLTETHINQKCQRCLQDLEDEKKNIITRTNRPWERNIKYKRKKKSLLIKKGDF